MPKQPSLQFSVMCLDLVEEEKKPPTLQYLFYELPFPYLPFRLDRFHVINCWSNGDGHYKQSIKILTPSRTKTFIETGEQAFALEDPYTPQLMINVFADLEFTEVGHYWVQNFLDEKLIMEFPLTVRLVESGKKPPTQPTPPVEAKKTPEPKKEPEKKPSLSSIPMDDWNIPK